MHTFAPCCQACLRWQSVAHWRHWETGWPVQSLVRSCWLRWRPRLACWSCCLSDGMLGMVISVNSGKPLRPSILIYDPSVSKNEAIILDLIDEQELNVSASLKPRQLEPEVYDYLSPRKRMTYFMDAQQIRPRT